MSLPICVYEKEEDVDLNKRVGGNSLIMRVRGADFSGHCRQIYICTVGKVAYKNILYDTIAVYEN